MNFKRLLSIFSLIVCSYTLSAQITLDSTVLDTSTVISGIDIPWEIQWGPDDWIWMTERYGRVSRVNPADGSQSVILDLTGSVHQQSESGLLGMVLHPDFMDTSYVYLVYTYLDGGIKERLVRYEYDGSNLINPFTILEDIPGNSTHDGSRLLVLPDRTLIMTTGDAQNQSDSQDPTIVSGKTLRFNLDGSIPADNPISGSPVWTWGHRNAQGLTLGPNGRIYSSEHGPQTDDELNLIEAGRNYGWPNVHGLCDVPNEMQFCTDSNVFEPLTNWTPTIATSDLIWYDHPSIPEFNGSLLMTVLKDKQLVSMKLNAAGDQIVSEKSYFTDVWGRLRDICFSPDGTIYLATNGANWANNVPFSHSIVALKNSNHPVGVATNTSKTTFLLWPQPAKDKVRLQVSSEWIGAQLRIYDTKGRLVEETTLNTQDSTINVSGLKSGLHMVSLQHKGNTEVRRLLIQ